MASFQPAPGLAGPGPGPSQPNTNSLAMVTVPEPGAVTASQPQQPPPSGIVPVLQNLVATVNLNTKITLQNVAAKARNAEYNPKRFAAAIIRIRDPKTTALIFASGKMVITGAKSEEDARVAGRKFAKIVQRTGFEVVFKDFKIQNVVGSADVKFPVRLEGLAYAHNLFCSYEPELFPGLIYRMKKPKVVLLIFVSGKVVLTGAKSRADMYEAFELIYPVLQGFKKGAATPASLPAPPAAQHQMLEGPPSSLGQPLTLTLGEANLSR